MADQPKAFPYIIQSKPGIRRDGTRFDGEEHYDGQWVRWDRGRARKMWGYRELSASLTGIQRGMHRQSKAGLTYMHVGAQATIQALTINNSSGVASGVTNRTPVGFASSDNYVWQFDCIFDGGGTDMLILAHAAPNLVDISNDVTGSVYCGDIYGGAALTAIASSATSGGVVSAEPYLFVYGSNGYVTWSVPNDPTDLTGAGSGEARITGQKIVKGVHLRAGGGNAPAVLFWSLDSVIRGTFVGGAAIFDFDALATTSSLLSARCVVEYDGVYFWAANNRFMFYNGVVRELPNALCLSFFFDNLLQANQGKCFGFANPRWGEIWWCFPFGDSTECDCAVIYNLRENTWYTTVLPGTMRSAGDFNHVYPYPLMTSATAVSGATSLWQHEIGVDEVPLSGGATAIRSYVETGDVSGLDFQQPFTRAFHVGVVEPDLIQRGPMTLTITGQANARAAIQDGTPVTFEEVPAADNPQEQVVLTKEERRHLRFRWESNVAGGDYWLGKSVAHLKPSVASDRYLGESATEPQE